KQRVIFYGWLDHNSPELRTLYQSCSIYAMPSQRENASVSLLEAMASGMAILTSDIPPVKETVGNSALTVPVGDQSALRTSLEMLLSNPNQVEQLGLSARQRVETIFDLRQQTDRYCQILAAAARPNV